MTSIQLWPAEGVEEAVIEVITNVLSTAFRLPVVRRGPLDEPDEDFDAGRGQYSSTAILRRLIDPPPEDNGRRLGITTRDIFIPMLSYVFGQAQLGGCAALVSLARLRQEFYHLPANPGLLLQRAAKEAIHEMGHTFGLTHCLDRGCAMSLSTGIEQVDEKKAEFCLSCQTLLQESMVEGGIHGER